jgi:hypothetical protein
LIALFLFSLCDYYRNHPGIFYTCIGFIALLITVSWSVDCHLSRKHKKKQHALWGSTRNTKSRIGQSTTLKRLRARLKAIKGYDVDVPVRLIKKRKG